MRRGTFALLAAWASVARAQTVTEEPRDYGVAVGKLRLGLLYQTRYSDIRSGAGNAAETLAAEQNGGWQQRRARLELKFDPAPWVFGEIYYDFIDAPGGVKKDPLKDAFVELKPRPWIVLTAGQFKRPFSLMHLRGVYKLEVAENGMADLLVVQDGYAGFDVGGMLTLVPLAPYLVASAGVFRGASIGQDASSHGSVGARVTTEPVDGLRFGAGLSWRPSDTPDPTGLGTRRLSGLAVGADVRASLGRWRGQLEVMQGDRTDDWLGRGHTFAGATLLTSYVIHLKKKLALEPAIKLEWLDADRQAPDGDRFMYTAAVNFDVRPHVRLLVEVERTEAAGGAIDLQGKRDSSRCVLDMDGTCPAGAAPLRRDIDTTLLLAQLQFVI